MPGVFACQAAALPGVHALLLLALPRVATEVVVVMMVAATLLLLLLLVVLLPGQPHNLESELSLRFSAGSVRSREIVRTGLCHAKLG